MVFATGTRDKALYVAIPEKKVIADRLYLSHETKWTLDSSISSKITKAFFLFDIDLIGSQQKCRVRKTFFDKQAH